jgi:hypothetical protein
MDANETQIKLSSTDPQHNANLYLTNDISANFGIYLLGNTRLSGSYQGLGDNNDVALFGSSTVNNINIYNQQGSNRSSHIRFYAGNPGGLFDTALSSIVPDLMIYGTTSVASGIYRGNVGIGLSGPNAKLHVKANTNLTGSTVFKVDGNVGELFSVTDSLVGSLMSVNDISGLPILEVFDDNTILMGDYQSPSLFTTIKVVLSSSTLYQTIYQISKVAYSSAFFEYNVQNSTNMRAGIVLAVWEATSSSIEYTETSTMDIGNTSNLPGACYFRAIISGDYVLFQALVDTSGWTIKTIVRSV